MRQHGGGKPVRISVHACRLHSVYHSKDSLKKSKSVRRSFLYWVGIVVEIPRAILKVVKEAVHQRCCEARRVNVVLEASSPHPHRAALPGSTVCEYHGVPEAPPPQSSEKPKGVARGPHGLVRQQTTLVVWSARPSAHTNPNIDGSTTTLHYSLIHGYHRVLV